MSTDGNYLYINFCILITDTESVKAKWDSLRDSYTKYKNKLKESSSSGSGAKNIRKYIYASLLEFTDLSKRKRQ